VAKAVVWLLEEGQQQEQQPEDGTTAVKVRARLCCGFREVSNWICALPHPLFVRAVVRLLHGLKLLKASAGAKRLSDHPHQLDK
jgi:hypothetical protein